MFLSTLFSPANQHFFFIWWVRCNEPTEGGGGSFILFLEVRLQTASHRGASVGLRIKFKPHNLYPVPCCTLKYIDVDAWTGFTQFISSVRIFIDPIKVNTNSCKGSPTKCWHAAQWLTILSASSCGDLHTHYKQNETLQLKWHRGMFFLWDSKREIGGN
jgi:hypothetical protein